jgi:hypothetical protein
MSGEPGKIIFKHYIDAEMVVAYGGVRTVVRKSFSLSATSFNY